MKDPGRSQRPHVHELLTAADRDERFLSREWFVRRRFARRLRLLDLPADLTGWSVLDVGAWHGYFSFECERRGADRVLAIDSYAWKQFGMDGFLEVHRRVDSKVEYSIMDVHDLNPEALGSFDLVLFLGVFYHLSNPLLALENLRQLTRRLMICETHLLLPFIHEKYALITFFPGDDRTDEQTHDFCGIPTLTCLQEMLRFVGYRDLDVKYAPSFRYWKKVKALLTNRPQTGRGIVHARP